LNEINALRHVANVSGRFELVGRLDDALGMYEREERDEGVEAKEVKSKIDEFGRAYATGRRKESSARVWMIPTKEASNILDQAKTETEGEATIPTTQVLINHLPLATHFEKTSDRDTVLRSLRITGLLGGYNVFALVRGGGTSGQAGAVGLAMARALAILREDVKEVLTAGMSLFRLNIALLMSRWSFDARYEDGREEKDWSGKGQKGSE
jgi:small subunit ribosomal protein S9